MSTPPVYEKIYDSIERVIVGRPRTVKFAVASLIAGGHVLLEDVPGTGKTMLAKSLAQAIKTDFKRVQFTPDLLPSDVTGLNVFHADSGEFRFHPGPVFTGILLADEINRATPRTQSGLLECMEERQVTIDGETHRLPEPFMVIATQNPVETAGTFPLPEAQLDRFLVKLSMGFPSQEEEAMILRHFERGQTVTGVTETDAATPEQILELRRQALNVNIHDDLVRYICALSAATRNRSDVLSGVSPRGTLALLRVSQVLAVISGRDHIIPEDIKEAAIPVLSHRLILPHGYSTSGSGENIIRSLLDSVPVPTENF